MKITQPLIPGTLIRRYKRFLADIQLFDKTIITAHCPNSGSMLGCSSPGSEVLLSYHEDSRRKYAYTWEMIKVNAAWVGVNTAVSNRLVYESLLEKRIAELAGYSEVFREPKVGQRSRLDLLLREGNNACYIEIKNVTMVEHRIAMFPDAVTVRGTRHLQELINLKMQGYRAVIFFVIQREDAEAFAPADHIDPNYGAKLRAAWESGVEILVYRAVVRPEEIRLDQKLIWFFPEKRIEQISENKSQY